MGIGSCAGANATPSFHGHFNDNDNKNITACCQLGKCFNVLLAESPKSTRKSLLHRTLNDKYHDCTFEYSRNRSDALPKSVRGDVIFNGPTHLPMFHD